MSYQDHRSSRWQRGQVAEPTPSRDHDLAPGKRTLTMSLPPRPTAVLAPVQFQPDPAAEAARAEKAALTEQWLDVAMRPDLHDAPVQRKSAGKAHGHASSAGAGASGRSLPDDLRTRMEHALGADFSAVRIHEGPQATAMGALAYTQGTNIHFAPGQYDPGSRRSLELLGHELTHVVQQAQGRVAATPLAKGQAINDEPSLEREADLMGARAAQAVTASGGAAASATVALSGASSLHTARRVPLGSRLDHSRAGIVQRKLDKEERATLEQDLSKYIEEMWPSMDEEDRPRVIELAARYLDDEHCRLDDALEKMKEAIDRAHRELLREKKSLLRIKRSFEELARPNIEVSFQEKKVPEEDDLDEEEYEGDDIDEEGSQEPSAKVRRLLESSEEVSQDIVKKAYSVIDLPPLETEEVKPSLLPELERQLAMQLAGLKQLTMKEWLLNVIINRMKTTDQQTRSGDKKKNKKQKTQKESRMAKLANELAGKIDTILHKNEDVARLVMDAIAERMDRLFDAYLKRGAKDIDGFLDIINRIQTAALTARRASGKEIYDTFRALKGLDYMALLTSAGISGGTGRQSGHGDNTWFRGEYAEGIELLKTYDPERLKKNACLHNPDQCVGGYMEIVWQKADFDEHGTPLVEKAKDRYNECFRTYRQAKWRSESYKKDKKKNLELISKGEKELQEACRELEQAISDYIGELKKHFGNYDINSLLGESWMSRIDTMLKSVLDVSPDDWEHTYLDVKMKLKGSGTGTAVDESTLLSKLSGSICQDPADKFFDNRYSMRLPEKSRGPRLTLDERIKNAESKKDGKKQENLFDWHHRSQTSRTQPRPKDYKEQVKKKYGAIEDISGSGLNCYIRALVTGLCNKGIIAPNKLEETVARIAEHLALRGLRVGKQPIDAGGSVAAEVRRVIQDLTRTSQSSGVELGVRVVQWNPHLGKLVDFDVNSGKETITLFFEPPGKDTVGHFDLINKK